MASLATSTRAATGNAVSSMLSVIRASFKPNVREKSGMPIANLFPETQMRNLKQAQEKGHLGTSQIHKSSASRGRGLSCDTSH